MVRHRRRRSSGLQRLLGFVAVVGVVVAGVAGAMAVRDHFDDGGVVLDVDPASAAVTPDTIEIDASAVERTSPSGLLIGDLQLEGEVRSVGIEDDGELEIPDATEIGWYRYGSAPGLPGATVLAAHVSWNGSIGPFHQLGSLDPGATVDVVLEDDSVRTYEVIERTMYLKDELPRDRIWRTTGEETLVLITCGGDFNRSIRRYEHNIVVYAVPVAERPPDVPPITSEDDPDSDTI